MTDWDEYFRSFGMFFDEDDFQPSELFLRKRIGEYATPLYLKHINLNEGAFVNELR